jgi:hypothetical protein
MAPKADADLSSERRVIAAARMVSCVVVSFLFMNFLHLPRMFAGARRGFRQRPLNHTNS